MNVEREEAAKNREAGEREVGEDENVDGGGQMGGFRGSESAETWRQFRRVGM